MVGVAESTGSEGVPVAGGLLLMALWIHTRMGKHEA
jgi:hypothetical protein